VVGDGALRCHQWPRTVASRASPPRVVHFREQTRWSPCFGSMRSPPTIGHGGPGHNGHSPHTCPPTSLGAGSCHRGWAGSTGASCQQGITSSSSPAIRRKNAKIAGSSCEALARPGFTTRRAWALLGSVVVDRARRDGADNAQNIPYSGTSVPSRVSSARMCGQRPEAHQSRYRL
jgi:hypothetical protein